MQTEITNVEATVEGIKVAWSNTPEDHKEAALDFVRQYAETHRYFDGGEVLAAWRKTGDPIALENWRNRWGAVMSVASNKWLHKAGKVRPKSVQSHTSALTLWESAIYKGDEPEIATTRTHLDWMIRECRARQITVRQLAWAAYELGLNEIQNEN